MTTISDILQDILFEIIAHVWDGSTYKSCALVSRAWHKAARAQSWKIEGMTNQFLELIRCNPDKPWNWYYVSLCPRLTVEFVSTHMHLPWDWEGLLFNDVICRSSFSYWGIINQLCDILQTHRAKPGSPLVYDDKWTSRDGVLYNITVSLDHIAAHPDFPWNWDYISRHPNINLQTILDHRELPWNWRAVSLKVYDISIVTSNPDINFDWEILAGVVKVTPAIVNQHYHRWNWSRLSKNPDITIDIVLEHLTERWEWRYLSKHPNMTFDIIQANPGLRWIMSIVSSRSFVTIDLINANPAFPWNIYAISEHPNITFDIIIANPRLEWRIQSVSRNPNITIDVIKANPTINWDWDHISSHQNITMDMVRDNPNMPWETYGLSINPNLTAAYVKSRPDLKWRWDIITENTFSNLTSIHPYSHTSI
jgi:hypothetical protein